MRGQGSLWSWGCLFSCEAQEGRWSPVVRTAGFLLQGRCPGAVPVGAHRPACSFREPCTRSPGVSLGISVSPVHPRLSESPIWALHRGQQGAQTPAALSPALASRSASASATGRPPMPSSVPCRAPPSADSARPGATCHGGCPRGCGLCALSAEPLSELRPLGTAAWGPGAGQGVGPWLPAAEWGPRDAGTAPSGQMCSLPRWSLWKLRALCRQARKHRRCKPPQVFCRLEACMEEAGREGRVLDRFL